MAKNLYNRYIWLVDTIYRAERITYKEISEKWRHHELSEGKDFPLRTFHNHRDAIEELFDINIECDTRGGNVYYIEDVESMSRSGVRTWLLNTLAVNNFINESHKLRHRILFEYIPSGERFLTSIIESMRDERCLMLEYHSFWSEPRTLEIAPYCVKVFKKRWYLVGCAVGESRIKIYALDRMLSITPSKRSFELPADFDPATYFLNSFGIIVDSGCKPVPIELKVTARNHKRDYFATLPLHPTQQEIEHKPDYSVYRYYLSPTYDFRQELLSHGAEIEVLSPSWLRAEIRDTIRQMSDLYATE
jgi:hypothetical protein